ncbi:hypothetical protein H0H92_001647, partial [Tricholoma furcatifolium]
MHLAGPPVQTTRLPATTTNPGHMHILGKDTELEHTWGEDDDFDEDGNGDSDDAETLLGY